MGLFNTGITSYADVRLNTHLNLWIGLSSWESACGLRPVNDRWMGRGVLLECLRHVFEVLMHRRLLIVYRTRQSASSFTHFHSEPLPAGQICQSKGRGRINIIRAGSASVALSPLGCHILDTSRHPFGIELRWDFTFSSHSWLCPCFCAHSLHLLGMSLILKRLISKYSIVCCVDWCYGQLELMRLSYFPFAGQSITSSWLDRR